MCGKYQNLSNEEGVYTVAPAPALSGIKIVLRAAVSSLIIASKTANAARAGWFFDYISFMMKIQSFVIGPYKYTFIVVDFAW